jgi:hypothetical protein
MQGNRTAGLHPRRIVRALAGVMWFLTFAVMAATPPTAITSPVEAAMVVAGSLVAITVNITSGSYPSGIAIVGQDPLGDADIRDSRHGRLQRSRPEEMSRAF